MNQEHPANRRSPKFSARLLRATIEFSDPPAIPKADRSQARPEKPSSQDQTYSSRPYHRSTGYPSRITFHHKEAARALPISRTTRPIGGTINSPNTTTRRLPCLKPVWCVLKTEQPGTVEGMNPHIWLPKASKCPFRVEKDDLCVSSGNFLNYFPNNGLYVRFGSFYADIT
jgi:hypothetical protein